VKSLFAGIIIGISISMLTNSLSYADLYESRLDRGLLNNDAYSFLLIEEYKKRDDKDLLEKARRYSPDLPATYFYIAYDRLDLSAKGIFDSIDYMRQGLKAYGRNFLWRFNLSGLVVKGAIISFFLSILLLIIIRLPSEGKLIIHEAGEDRKKGIILLLPLFFSFSGFLPMFASMLSIIGFYLRKKDRIVIYLSFLIILSFSAMPGIGRIFSIPSYLKAVVMVNEGRDNSYGLLRLKERKDLPSSFAYALALKREGFYHESIDIYRRLAERHRLPQIFINLGNALYAIQDIEGARTAYMSSLSIKPLSAAFYNLSQVHRLMLDFKKGDEYFEEAARLDPEGLRRFTSISGMNPNRFVIDEKLPDPIIWEHILSERDGLIQITLTTILTAMVILSFFVLDRMLKNRAKRCSRCGSIFCNKCSRTITWKNMCSRCYSSLIRMDQMYSKDRIANLLLVYEGRAKRRSIARILSMLIPGGGQIYSGKILEGFFMSWASIFSLITIILSRLSSSGIYPFRHGWILPPALLLIIVLYALSIIHIRREIQKGWL